MPSAIVTHADVGAGATIDERLTNSGYEVHRVAASVTRRDMAAEIRSICADNDVDLLVNNPWLPTRSDLSDAAAEFAAALDGGLHTVFSAGREAAAAAHTKKRPLTIINVCSATGLVAVPGRLAEACTSAGLIAMTRALAAEWGPLGIRVTAVVVGPTDSWADVGPVPGVIPLGHTVSDADVAASVEWAASAAARGVVGSSITVDNGWLANGWRPDD